MVRPVLSLALLATLAAAVSGASIDTSTATQRDSFLDRVEQKMRAL